MEPDRETVARAIDDVFASYETPSADHQVLVQPMVEDVVISGVVLTRDLDTGAPYYVVNYDDFSGRTDTVTGGAVSKMVMVHRGNPDALHSPRMRKLIAVVQEIEAVTGCDELDIEFCATADLTFYVLQVRPLAARHAWQGVADDVIADALIHAAQEVGFRVPVVVRLEGTNVEKARQMLEAAAIKELIPASDLTDAAKKVCGAVG